MGCFNASQTFIGDLTEFAIYDTALTPDEVSNMADDGSCGDHRPIITLEKEATMIFGVPEFKSGKFKFSFFPKLKKMHDGVSKIL